MAEKYLKGPDGKTIALTNPTEGDLKAAANMQGGKQAEDYSPEVANTVHNELMRAQAAKSSPGLAFAENAIDAFTLGAAKPALAAASAYAVGSETGVNPKDLYRDNVARIDAREGTAAGVAGTLAGFAAGGFMGGPVEALGSLAERAAARALPEAVSIGGKMLVSGTKMAVRGGAEGALIQTAMDASRAVLHDNPVTVESVLASATHGALWGFGIGGAIGVAAEGASAAVAKLAERYAPAKQVEKVLGGLGVSERRVQEMTERAGGTEQLYGQIKRVMEETGTTSVKDLLKNAKSASVSLGESVKAAAKEANGLGVDWAQVKGRIGERMIVEGAPMSKAQAIAESQIASIKDFESFVAVRNKLSASKSAGAKAVVGMLDGEVRTALESAAGVAGVPEVAEKFMGAVAAKATADSLAQAALNVESVAKKSGGVFSSVGFGDASLAAGALASGHPIAAAAALAKGAVMSEMSRALSNTMFDMGVAGKLDSMVSKVSETIQKSATKFLRPALGARAVAMGNMKEYEDARAEFSRLASPPAQMAMADSIAPVARVNPGLAANMAKSREKAVQYLAQMAPADRSKTGSISILAQPKASSLDMSEHAWLRAWKAVTDPQSVIKAVGDGSASKDEVAALREVYPALYGELLKGVMSGVADAKASGKGFGMSKVVELGILMDAPVDSTLRPEYVQLIQSYHGAMSQAQQQAQPPPPGGSNLSATKLPKTQKMEM